MRWSLVTIFALVAVTLPLYPGIHGERVARDDGNEGGDAGWIQNLLNTIMGTDNKDNGKSDTETTTTTTTTTATTLPSGKVELVDLDDMDLDGNETENSTSAELTEPLTATYDESEGLSKDGDTITDTPASTPVTTTMSTSTSTGSSTTKNPECDKPNDMTIYCDLSDDFKTYMHGNTSTDSLTQKLFSPIVVNQLLDKCPPGKWCLSDDYRQAFSDSMSDIFRGPLCSEGLLECVELMLSMRKGCPDMLWLSTFEDALSSLICEMNSVPGLTPECFGHTLATLHVTLADEIRQASKERNNGTEFCLGSFVGMTRKFLCTLEKCPNHQQLFENFQPWQWFMDDAPVIKDICKLDKVCGDKELLAEKSESTTTDFSTSTTESALTKNTTDQSEQNDHVDMAGDKPYFIIQASDESTRLLIGITTGTIIAVLGLMVLVCAVLKRMRRRNRRLAKEGYSKLPTDDMN